MLMKRSTLEKIGTNLMLTHYEPDPSFHTKVKRQDKGRLMALCMSEWCNKEAKAKNTRGSPRMGVERSVKKSEVFCPECKHALFWCHESDIRDISPKNKTGP